MAEKWGEDTVAIDAGDTHTAETIVSPITKRAWSRRPAWSAPALLALLALGATLLLASGDPDNPAGTARESRALPHHRFARTPHHSPGRRQGVRRPAHRIHAAGPHRAVGRPVPRPPAVPATPPSEEPVPVVEEPAYEAPAAPPPPAAPTSPAAEFGM
jgi:hypothetical protein